MLRTPAAFSPLLAPPAAIAGQPLNLVFCGDSLLVRDGDLSTPADDGPAPTETAAQERLPLLPEATLRWLPVGLLGAQYCRTAWLPAGTAAPQGWSFRKLRALFGAIHEDLVAVAGRAFQIAEWDRTHRFCGACGGPTAQVAGERCARCRACGHMAYPRISPAMMVLIRKGEAVLLARHTQSPTRFFTALAGFLEAGESVEDAIHREVFEEVGLRVRDIRYFGSQPWPFPHSLMIAYTAEYVSGSIVVDEAEIAEARWFGPGDPLPNVPPLGLSIAGHLIHAHLPAAPAAAGAAGRG